MKRTTIILALALALPALAGWEVVLNAPDAITNGLPEGVAATSLMGKAIPKAGGGYMYALGGEGPARDNWNRLTAAGCAPSVFPALIETETGYTTTATASNITNRATLLQAWLDSLPPRRFNEPIQARLEVPVAPDHVHRLEIDPEDGGVFAVEIESERLTPAQYAAAKSAKLAARATARTGADDARKKMDEVIATLGSVDTTKTKAALDAIKAAVEKLSTASKDATKPTSDSAAEAPK
jgi:hypothetical protein